ncbi:MAG: hypothetical protein ACRC8U_00940, partial [Brooklawnia sp.]
MFISSDAPTDPIACLKDNDVLAPTAQFDSRSQTRESCSDNHAIKHSPNVASEVGRAHAGARLGGLP